MALIKCEECGKEMSDKAESCPSCGYSKELEEKSKDKVEVNNTTVSNNLNILGTIIIIGLIIFGGYKLFFDKGDMKTQMWKMVQKEARGNLKDDKFKFDKIDKVKFFLVNKDTYEVYGMARKDTEVNSFIATVTVDGEKPVKVTNVEVVADNKTWATRVETAEVLDKRLQNGKSLLTEKELNDEIKKQPLYVEKVVYQDAKKFKSSLYSMLQAVLYNNSDVAIKKAEVAFVAWDKDKNPILIKKYSVVDGDYYMTLALDNMNLKAGKKYTGIVGDSYYGMQIDKNLEIAYAKAIVVSVTDENGKTWENPYVGDFRNLYENKKLVN